MFVGALLDDYLGPWFATDSKGSTSMHFCFRIAEDEIGMKDIHLMDDKHIDSQYKVNGNKINGFTVTASGEYEMDAGVIIWKTTSGRIPIWSRPGN